MTIEKRKLEISFMKRQELNAHAYLLEKEQEEYEETVNQQAKEIFNLVVARDSVVRKSVEQSKQLELAVKALEHYAKPGAHPPFWLYERGELAKTTLAELKRISTEGVTADTKTCKECEAHQQEIETLNVLIEQKDKEYAELEEQADRWREESGN